MPDSSTPSPAAPVAPGTPAKAVVPPTIDPKAAPAKTEAVKSAPLAEETWDVQIDGKPVKKTRKEILEAYQLRELSDKKRSEAEKTLGDANKFFQAFKADPIKAMKAMGLDFDSMSTQYLAKKAEEAMLDPKERELQKARQEAETYKKWVEEQKALQEKTKKEAEISASRQAIHKEIIDAIEAEASNLGLPVDEELVIAVAQKMILQDMKQKPLNAKEALPKAYESQQKFLKGIASKMDGEALVKWLGPEVAMKIRKHDLQQLKAKRQVVAPQARVETPKDAPSKAPRPMTWSEFKATKLDTIK